MYLQYYGLREKPFSLIPDPDFLYLSKGHTLALSLLEYGLREQTGFVVITGEIGSGKTTLVQRILRTVADDIVIGLVNNTHPSFGELLQWIDLAFDIDPAGKGKVDLHQAFVGFLIDQYAAGRRVVVIIDEAQNLAQAALEEVRMLSNINAGKDYLLQLILIGQPELHRKLRRPQLKQFVQRIGISHHIDPLDLGDTMRYIRHRVRVAGGGEDLFDDRTCAAVYFYANGVPRLINTLCDLALVYGYAEERPRCTADTVIEVALARIRGGLAPFRADAQALDRDKARAAIARLLAPAEAAAPAGEAGRLTPS